MAGTAGSTTRHKSFPVGVAAGTIATNKMAVICTVIVRVMACFCMAGLADSVPGLFIIIKGEVLRSLLEDSNIKGTLKMPRFVSNET